MEKGVSAFSLILFAVAVLLLSCDTGTNPTPFSKDKILGRWVLKKIVEYESEKNMENGKIDEVVDTESFIENDIRVIHEINDDYLIYYEFKKTNPYYIKNVIPYTLSGNDLIGEFFSEEDIEDEFNFKKKYTKIDKEDGQLVIYHTVEEQKGESDWWVNEKFTEAFFHDTYSQQFPPEEWPDSCVVDSMNAPYSRINFKKSK